MSTPMPIYAVAGLAAYTLVLLFASLLAVLQVWPGTQHLAESENPVRVFQRKTTLPRERHLLVIVFFMGLLGAATSSVWGLAYRVQGGNLQASEFLAYVVRPWIGCGVTMIFYGLLRGGLFTGAGASKEINVYGTAGLAGLAGFSATDLAAKLLRILG